MIDSHVSMRCDNHESPYFNNPWGTPHHISCGSKTVAFSFAWAAKASAQSRRHAQLTRSIHIYIYIDIGLRSSLSSDCKSVRWQYCCSSALFSNTSLLRPYSTSGRPSSFLPSFLPSFPHSSLTHLLTSQQCKLWPM